MSVGDSQACSVTRFPLKGHQGTEDFAHCINLDTGYKTYEAADEPSSRRPAGLLPALLEDFHLGLRFAGLLPTGTLRTTQVWGEKDFPPSNDLRKALCLLNLHDN